MRFVVAALAVMAVASPLSSAMRLPPAGSGALAKEIQDFLNLIPLDECTKIVRAYIAHDKQVQALLEIAASPESVAYIKEIEAVPEFKQLMNYFQKAGLDIYLMVNKMNEALKLDAIVPLSSYAATSGNGVHGLLNDLKAVLPMNKLRALYAEKEKNSVVFQNLIKEVTSKKYHPLILAVLQSKNVQSIALASEKIGVSGEDFSTGYSVLLSAHIMRSIA
ncbi:protein G12-like [Augochlora pura]